MSISSLDFFPCAIMCNPSFQAGKGGELTHDETTIISGALDLTEKVRMTLHPFIFRKKLISISYIFFIGNKKLHQSDKENEQRQRTSGPPRIQY